VFGRITPEMKQKKRILHIDMDAFFASVEQRDLPSLRGKPVIVGGMPGKRGVVATCSYEAREYGVHSGMPISEAEKKCPHAIYLKTYGRKYLHAFQTLLKIFQRYTPAVEPVSIDEAYLDISGSMNLYDGEENLAQALKDEIKKKLKLTCTIGIAPNKVFAKLASGLEKPDGLTIIKEGEVEEKVYPLSVSKLWGIGEKTEKILNGLEIRTIGDLAAKPVKILKHRFGIYGETLQKMARGEEFVEIMPIGKQREEKSIGNEHTFSRDSDNLNYVHSELLHLSQKVGRRLREKKYGAKIITLKLRYEGFFTLTHRMTISHFIYKDSDIYSYATGLFKQKYEIGKKVRLVGISLSRLSQITDSSGSLFMQKELFPQSPKENNLYNVLDNLKDKYGEKVVKRGNVPQLY